MNIIKGTGNFFALDIGTNAIRVVQLSNTGGWSLDHYGYVPVDSKIIASDSQESRNRLGEAIMTAIGQSGIKTKDVVIGLPSNKTFTTVIDVPMSTEAELKATMKYQIDQYIPMSIDEAKVDWALLGPSPRANNQQEVLLTSTANNYAEDRLDFIEGLGLNVIAAEPDPIAMIRALANPSAQGASLILDMGEHSTDIAVVTGDTPRLIRTIPTGLGTLVKAVVQNLNVQDDQARQFILKFGLATDRLEGQVYKALENTLDSFTSEVMKSVKFFQTRYPNLTVSDIALSGFSGAIPQFGDYVATKTSIKTQAVNPWQNIRVSSADQQQLAAVGVEFATAIGLAKRSNRL